MIWSEGKDVSVILLILPKEDEEQIGAHWVCIKLWEQHTRKSESVVDKDRGIQNSRIQDCCHSNFLECDFVSEYGGK